MKRRQVNTAIFIIIAMLISLPMISYADYGTIKIDGHYDDWEDKPHTEVYKGSNPKDKAINMVSLFRDELNIYVHIIFSQQYSSGIKNMRVELITNLGDGYFELRESSSYDLIGNIDNLRSKNSSKEDPAAISFNGKDPLLVETVADNDLVQADERIDNNVPEQSDAGTVYSNEYVQADEESNGNEYVQAEKTNGNEPTQADEKVNGNEPTQADEETYGNEYEQLDDGIPDREPAQAGEENTDEENTDGEDEFNVGSGGNEEDNPTEEGIEPDDNLDDFGDDSLMDRDQTEQGLRVFNVYQNDDLVGEGYMVIQNRKVIEAEFYIPLDTVSAQPDGISEISMQIKKLGQQWIHSVGAGTNPFLGIAISIVLSICIVFIGISKYRKKRTSS